MSLVAFHRGLIAAAIVFCAGYGVWELLQYSRTGSGTSLALGVLFPVLAVGLGYYLSRLGRFLGYEESATNGER
jgi:hypothetical protein